MQSDDEENQTSDAVAVVLGVALETEDDLIDQALKVAEQKTARAEQERIGRLVENVAKQNGNFVEPNATVN